MTVLSASKKIKNDALEDEYLLANIKITNDSINEGIFDIIDLGEISGRAKEADGGWLLYKIKKRHYQRGRIP